jgi:hypothetical protein
VLSLVPGGCQVSALCSLWFQAVDRFSICKCNDGVGVVPWHAVISEQGVQEGTEHTPLRGPCVEDQCGECVVTYPYHLGGGLSGSPGSTCRGRYFSPSVFNLLMNFEGTMVLNAEL